MLEGDIHQINLIERLVELAYTRVEMVTIRPIPASAARATSKG